MAAALGGAAALIVLMLAGSALSLLRSARRLSELARDLEARAELALGQVETALAAARAELERVDDLVGSAEALTETVGSAARLAHAALATPLIKAMALKAGTARASKRLRRAG
jgi:3-oxoacyl-[acyl-carrier-protein] synthase III